MRAGWEEVGTWIVAGLALVSENWLAPLLMLGLILAIGIVIDDAVVVHENIFRHMEEDGMDGMEAARIGTVTLQIVLDEDVIGGIRVQVGDEVVDGTVLRRLDEARRHITGG